MPKTRVYKVFSDVGQTLLPSSLAMSCTLSLRSTDPSEKCKLLTSKQSRHRGMVLIIAILRRDTFQDRIAVVIGTSKRNRHVTVHLADVGVSSGRLQN